MAKTCRACEFCYPRYGCSEPKMPLPLVTADHLCIEYKPRETPLLVDMLAKALRELEAVHDSSVYRPHSRWDEAVQQAREALARHQKEIGDDEEAQR